MPHEDKPSTSNPRDVVYIQDGVRIENDDGGYTVTNRDGVVVSCGPDGSIDGKLPVIRALSVADISRVTQHSIARVFDTVSHTLHFEGGGVLSYMHSSTGEGYEFSGRNVYVEMSSDGVVIVHGTTPD
ncbi:hypothetical protein [Ralstonia holmesii]|uniref:hypothetical protein n=1 Tax=Ralstonia holmesii TaxID=3058602 RepID=UPI003D64FA46